MAVVLPFLMRPSVSSSVLSVGSRSVKSPAYVERWRWASAGVRAPRPGRPLDRLATRGAARLGAALWGQAATLTDLEGRVGANWRDLDPIDRDQSYSAAAAWGRTLVNDVAPKPSDEYIAIARAARDLAAALEAGEGGETVRHLGAVGRARTLTLAVDPAGPTTASLRVTGPSGEMGAQPLKTGTRAQVVRFLRRVTTPSAALRAMNGMINKQKRVA